jgi:hypothetical protein
MARQKTEPFAWGKTTGLLQQWMLRDYIRWLFPQLGAAYIPPLGVKDFTLGEQDRLDGRQPLPFQPRTSSGVVFSRDLVEFKDYVFAALRPESDKNPYTLSLPTRLVFVRDVQKLHTQILLLISKKRRA